jgi:ABC-2 type transport system ATP-binding protein
MSIIEIKNLTKLYKNGRGIKNVSINVEKGDILGLLGPNGSGKTTIMKAVSGLVRQDKGTIKLFGLDVSENFEKIMAKTGTLIEAPALYKDLSAYKNLEIHARMYPGIDKEHINHILEVVHLTEYKNDKAGRFSLGMKQRLGLAIALLSDPELIILDEPVNGLDIEGVVEVREIIKQLSEKKGVTFMISSHMASEIEKTCTKTAVMYGGELIAFETMEDALRLHPSLEDYFLSVVKDRRGEIVL